MVVSQLVHSSSIAPPFSTYIYAITLVDPLCTNLAVISSDDSLRILDPTTLQSKVDFSSGKVHEGVTCLKSFDGLLSTAGQDAAIRIWDPKDPKTEKQCLKLDAGRQFSASAAYEPLKL